MILASKLVHSLTPLLVLWPTYLLYVENSIDELLYPVYNDVTLLLPWI